MCEVHNKGSHQATKRTRTRAWAEAGQGEYKGKQTATDLLLLTRLFVVTEANSYQNYTKVKDKDRIVRRLSPTHHTLQQKLAGKSEKDHHAV